MKTKTPKTTSADAVYESYAGCKRFEVEHPAHRSRLIVAAPDENAAIVAAAARWGEKWTAYDFYANCCVNEVRTAQKGR